MSFDNTQNLETAPIILQANHLVKTTREAVAVLVLVARRLKL